jgi:hypothetical protein
MNVRAWPFCAQDGSMEGSFPTFGPPHRCTRRGVSVVGTWVRTGRGAGRTLQATAFTQFSERVEAALPRLYDPLP